MDRPLLHSLLDLEPIVSNLIRAARPKTVLEIGVGEYSPALDALCREVGADLTSFDTHPRHHHSGTVAMRSLDAIRYIEPPGFDLAVIDGDHNYHTVFNELDAIYRLNPNAVCLLHDVGWPCGRRDMYYDVSAIPSGILHPWTSDGCEPGNHRTVPWGFRGEGEFVIACREGGPRNGVLTAVEDWMKATSVQFRFDVIPSVFGLGVLRPAWSKDFGEFSRIAIVFDEVVRRHMLDAPLLERLERNRVELYCAVLKLQWLRSHGG